LLDAIHNYVYKLNILEVMCELDLFNILSKLKNLTYLQVTLGRKKAGMNFEKSMVGMKLSDMENLTLAIAEMPNLVKI
jgi:hypothetical protein